MPFKSLLRVQIKWASIAIFCYLSNKYWLDGKFLMAKFSIAKYLEPLRKRGQFMSCNLEGGASPSDNNHLNIEEKREGNSVFFSLVILPFQGKVSLIKSCNGALFWKNIKILARPVPCQDFELVPLSLCSETMNGLLSRCPFVPGQWMDFCPFVLGDKKILSRWKPYSKPWRSLKRPPCLNTDCGTQFIVCVVEY